MRALRRLATLCALLAVSGCTTFGAGLDTMASDAETGSIRAGYTSTRQPITFETAQQSDPQSVIGKSQHPKILAEFGGAYGDPEMTAYVNRIGDELAGRRADLRTLDLVALLPAPEFDRRHPAPSCHCSAPPCGGRWG